MIILVGASASGKTEIAKLMIKKFGLVKVVTTTTRPMRAGETQDIDYHFITKDEFIKNKLAGNFLETAIYNGNFYGTSKKDVSDNKIVIVEPQGANSIYLEMKDKVKIFYLEATPEERERRMHLRKDKENDIVKRIQNDMICFTKDKLLHIDYVIDTTSKSIEELADMIYILYNKKA